VEVIKFAFPIIGKLGTAEEPIKPIHFKIPAIPQFSPSPCVEQDIKGVGNFTVRTDVVGAPQKVLLKWHIKLNVPASVTGGVLPPQMRPKVGFWLKFNDITLVEATEKYCDPFKDQVLESKGEADVTHYINYNEYTNTVTLHVWQCWYTIEITCNTAKVWLEIHLTKEQAEKFEETLKKGKSIVEREKPRPEATGEFVRNVVSIALLVTSISVSGLVLTSVIRSLPKPRATLPRPRITLPRPRLRWRR